MNSVLFVDDEPRILEALRRMLRPMQHEWQMEFTSSGHAALEAMRQRPSDIVVSDMKMPGMNGAELLTEVQRRWPESVRIILSGQSSGSSIMEAAGRTHQYLSKPCEPASLKKTLERVFAIRSLLPIPSIRKGVGEMSSLPSQPTLFRDVTRELRKPDASLERIGRIAGQDIGMTAKLLQFANSSYHNSMEPSHDVGRVVEQLGLETLRALAFDDVFPPYEGADIPGFCPESLRQRSMHTAAFARAIAREQDLDDEAMHRASVAGVLCGAGTLILATQFPALYTQILQQATREGVPVAEVELERLGTTHAEIGAYLMGLWGCSDSVVKTITYHAKPGTYSGLPLGTLSIVHVASVLAQQLDAEHSRPPSASVDPEYLASLGVQARLPAWREACRRVLESGVELKSAGPNQLLAQIHEEMQVRGPERV